MSHATLKQRINELKAQGYTVTVSKPRTKCTDYSAVNEDGTVVIDGVYDSEDDECSESVYTEFTDEELEGA